MIQSSKKRASEHELTYERRKRKEAYEGEVVEEFVTENFLTYKNSRNEAKQEPSEMRGIHFVHGGKYEIDASLFL